MKSTRCCSQCGSNGHNSRTCRLPPTSTSSSSATTPAAASGGVMLFGVRINEDPMRKSVSMNDLSQYEHVDDIPVKVSDAAGVAEDAAAAKVGDDLAAGAPTGYASADDAGAHPSSAAARERKRGVPWTEEEHKLFLMGLQKVGKGDWRGISRNFVKTRTPTQVASHAQKYFLRKSNLNRRRRRSSLFDITADTVPVKPLEEQPKQEHRDETSIIPTGAPAPSVAENSGMNNNNGYGVAPFSVSVGPYYMPVQVQNHPHGNMPVSFVHPVQVPLFTIPSPSPSVINLNERMMMVNPEPSPMSWKLSLSSSSSSKPSSDQSYRAGSYKGGDSFITVS